MTRVSHWNWDSDWSQTRAINELDQEIEAERQFQQRRLREARAEFSSGLKQVDSKLSSVSDRIETILEWTDLRFQLIEFDEHAARQAIRRPFRALAGGLPAVAPDVEDVPGYWLPPAAVALLRLVTRSGAVSGPFADLGTSLELARERDAVRSELFTLAVALCFDQPAFIDASALRLLGEPTDLGLSEPGEVAAGWRTLWEHAALGEFGPSAEALLRERLAALFDPEAFDEEELRAWDRAILTFGGVDAASPSEAEAFERLRGHLLAAEAPRAPEVAVEPDERWRQYLQELIEEPSPAELPLVEAMEELHLPEDRLQRSHPAWADSAGTVAALVRRDLLDPDGAPALRAIALELAAPLLRSCVERLGETPETLDPITRVVKRVGSKITVGRDGHDAAELEAAERRIEQNMSLAGPSKPLLVTAFAFLGLAVLIPALGGPWPLAVLCLIGTAVPLWLYRKGGDEQAMNREHCERQIARLRTEVEHAKDAVREAEAERAERVAALGKAREALLASLPEARSGPALR